MAISGKGAPCPQDSMLMGVRWSVADPWRSRHGEALLEERGVPVDHAPMPRWVVHYSPLLAAALHRRKRSVWRSGRMDDTDIKGKGQWRARSRAVEHHGQPMDLLLTEHRDEAAALRFLHTAMRRHGVPEQSTIDGSAAHAAAIKRYHAAHGTALIMRQGNYRHKIVAQEHRGVKRVPRPMLGCKALTAAQDTLVGLALRPMIKKRQLVIEEGDEGRTAAEWCYALAASSLPQTGVSAPSRPPEQNLRHNPPRHPGTVSVSGHACRAVWGGSGRRACTDTRRVPACPQPHVWRVSLSR